MADPSAADQLRRLIEHVPDVCLIETDAGGILTYFGPAAEEFFRCPAREAVGRLHYRDFHDPTEMEACRDDPAFREAMERKGWTEETWRIVPRGGEPFQARVTLMRATSTGESPPGAATDAAPGWMALYRRIL